MFRLFDSRLVLMLTEDDPTFANWDQDETAIRERYAEQDPEVVADELEAAAQTLVARIAALDPDQLDRTGRRSNGAEFTVVTLLQYFLHDVVHHLWDVTGQQDAAASLSLWTLAGSARGRSRQRASRSSSSASASSRSCRLPAAARPALVDVVDQVLQLAALAGRLVVQVEDVGDLGQGETEPLAAQDELQPHPVPVAEDPGACRARSGASRPSSS